MDKQKKQLVTVKVMDDEDFIDYLLTHGEKPKKVKKLWKRLRKIKEMQ